MNTTISYSVYKWNEMPGQWPVSEGGLLLTLHAICMAREVSDIVQCHIV